MPDTPKRSLILAGGGLKVAFQAGVLQVWLDEAQLSFDHADGASGGCFNLAMWCQGMSGLEIAENWRTLDPSLEIDFNWSQYGQLFFAESLFELDGFRNKVFPHWGLDWGRIRGSDREATFNVYNFTRHELAILTPNQMTEDFLVASVSLPRWFPPVRINGEIYIDAVYNTDANLEEAIRRGADELWVIWTVSERGEWSDGFVNNYFQIIEIAANGRYKQILDRIRKSNEAISQSKAGEFGRPITVKELKADVAVHYLLNLSKDRLAEAVNAGVEAGRRWCREEEIPLRAPGPAYPSEVHEAHTTLRFTEDMKGYITLGETDPQRGFERGREAGSLLHCHLTITVHGVNRFVTNPTHEASIEGEVRCEALGGNRPVEEGVFNLFVDKADPREKRMLYRIFFTDVAGESMTLSGHKVIRDDPGLDLWTDTTTLYTRVLRGHLGPDEERDGEIVGAGIIRISLPDFMKQLTTFRPAGPTSADRVAATNRFGRLFLGKLWDVYATHVLAVSPV